MRFAGNPVLGEVADGSGVGLPAVNEEVIIGCEYDNCNYWEVKSDAIQTLSDTRLSFITICLVLHSYY